MSLHTSSVVAESVLQVVLQQAALHKPPSSADVYSSELSEPISQGLMSEMLSSSTHHQSHLSALTDTVPSTLKISRDLCALSTRCEAVRVWLPLA